LALADDGVDPQAALDRPRFMIDAQEQTGAVMLEEGIPADTAAGLQSFGP
jgi:hypothetical protein